MANVYMITVPTPVGTALVVILVRPMREVQFQSMYVPDGWESVRGWHLDMQDE